MKTVFFFILNFLMKQKQTFLEMFPSNKTILSFKFLNKTKFPKFQNSISCFACRSFALSFFRKRRTHMSTYNSLHGYIADDVEVHDFNAVFFESWCMCVIH